MEESIADTMERHKRGLVLVITGDGKGKTTSCLGQALRSFGHGNKVLIIQFMKGEKYGEILAIENYLSERLTAIQCGLPSFVMKENPAPLDVELAQKGLKIAEKSIASGEYQMIILDEINVAMDFGLIEVEDVVELIRNKPPMMDLVLSGRYAPVEIIELADMVSEVREIKHHYHQGVTARAGIEH